MWDKYTLTWCIPEKTTPTRFNGNLFMIEEIEVWRMSPLLRGSVEVLQLWEVILHKEVQEDPSDH
jgi:hypothetical protein